MVRSAGTRRRSERAVEPGRCAGERGSPRCSTSRSSTATSSAARTRRARARACRCTAARSRRRRCAPRARRCRPIGLPHSLHGYFLRPGRVDRPVILHVDRDRDGGSFSARHVRAVQDGEVIFSMVASFHAREDSATFDAVPTRGGPDPSTLAGASVAVPRRGPGSDADAHRRRTGSPLRFALGARVVTAPRRSAGARVRGRVRLRPRLRVRPGRRRPACPPADRASITACGSTSRSAPTSGCCSSCGR